MATAYLTLVPTLNINDRRRFFASLNEAPTEVKKWACCQLYNATDWYYHMSDDSRSYDAGKQTVDYYWFILSSLYPNLDDLLAVHNSYASEDLKRAY